MKCLPFYMKRILLSMVLSTYCCINKYSMAVRQYMGNGQSSRNEQYNGSGQDSEQYNGNGQHYCSEQCSRQPAIQWQGAN